MRTTMDKAGRVVIPAALRERLGLLPGPVDVFAVGTGIQIEVPAHDNLVEEDGLLVVPGEFSLSVDELRELRLADQR